jgi:hypothetical protein
VPKTKRADTRIAPGAVQASSLLVRRRAPPRPTWRPCQSLDRANAGCSRGLVPR